MLTWLGRSIASIVLLNLTAIGALAVAFAWHYRLKPKLEQRRARQRGFERLLARSMPANEPPFTETSEALGSHGGG